MALSIAACSPHPSSGEWMAAAETANPYARLKVEFDGKAYLFVPDEEGHRVRCFWAGESASAINMDCMLNDPSERRFPYQFQVEGNRGTLLDNGKAIGRFQRK